MTLNDAAAPAFEPTVEERFLWSCARGWRSPASLDAPPDLDWARVTVIGRDNRMQTLLWGIVEANQWQDHLAEPDRAALRDDAARTAASAAIQAEALHRYLTLADERAIPTAVLKGLSVSVNVYGDPAMRPGGDIDILVRRGDVEASLRILDEMGIGRHWPNLLDDAYYERHHLHQQRCTADLKIWFEIHWALDHPLTLLTIDYSAMMDRTTSGTLLGAPVAELALPDLLLSLCIHLVKHAVYLPAVFDRPDLPRIILADGMMMYFLDVAELIGSRGEAMDWEQVIRLAEAGGAVDIVGSVLSVCARHFGSTVPSSVLQRLPVTGPGRTTRKTMQAIVDYESDVYLGQTPSKVWEFMLVTNGAFILRPIRALDLSAYLFPSGDFLQRRYGSSGAGVRLSHTVKAAGQYSRLGLDTLTFSWERYRRLKRLNQSASLFNRLEVDT